MGVKATNLFISKMAQIKQVNIKDFLRNFSQYGSQIATFKPHDFVVINEDALQYLVVEHFKDDADKKRVAKGLTEYLEYLEQQQKRESLASFASGFLLPQYNNAQSFIFENCPKIAQKLFTFTSSIK